MTARSVPQRRAAAGGVTVLHPGDVAIGHRGDRFETLLGSCIAVVLTDPRRTLGAMCHFVHSKPALAAAAADGGAGRNAAHADDALATLYEMLLARSIVPSLCEAYVVGGGNMFPHLVAGEHVGAANARWAMDALARDRVRVLHHDVGGTHYRRLAWTVGPDAPRVVSVPASVAV